MDKLGKKFEQKLKEDFLKTVSDSTIDRIYDSVSGYKSVSNVCDFIGYKEPNIFYIECKTKKEQNLPFNNITQYDKLIEKVDIPGVRTGVVVWFYEKDKVYYIPIKTVKQIKEDGRKSISIKLIEENKYRVIEIPSIKKRVFMDSDYSVLTTLKDGD